MFIEGEIHVSVAKGNHNEVSSWIITGPKLPCLPQIGSTLMLYHPRKDDRGSPYYFKILDVEMRIEWSAHEEESAVSYKIYTEPMQMKTSEGFEDFKACMDSCPQW